MQQPDLVPGIAVAIQGEAAHLLQGRLVIAEPQLAHNRLGDDSLFNASPAVARDRMILRSDRYLYCIGDAKGK